VKHRSPKPGQDSNPLGGREGKMVSSEGGREKGEKCEKRTVRSRQRRPTTKLTARNTLKKGNCSISRGETPKKTPKITQIRESRGLVSREAAADLIPNNTTCKGCSYRETVLSARVFLSARSVKK